MFNGDKTPAPKFLDLEMLKEEIQLLSKHLGPRQLVLLMGPMGAGKTKCVQFLVEALGGRWVSSPTFAIHQIYSTPIGEVDHFDLYRLKSDLDLESTGFWDVFSKEKGMVLVEWADRLSGDWIPPGWSVYAIRIEPTEKENYRKLQISSRF